MVTRTNDRRAAPKPKPNHVPDHLLDVEAAAPILCTPDEAGALIRMSIRSVRYLLARGELRVIRTKPGGHVMIPRRELLRWLAERSSPDFDRPAPPPGRIEAKS